MDKSQSHPDWPVFRPLWGLQTWNVAVVLLDIRVKRQHAAASWQSIGPRCFTMFYSLRCKDADYGMCLLNAQACFRLSQQLFCQRLVTCVSRIPG